MEADGKTQFSVKITIDDPASGVFVASYGTADHTLSFEGITFPSDLRLVSAVVDLVKGFHKHGVQYLAGIRD